MASLITLANLRLEAQQRADMENSTFLSTTEWNTLINKSAKELYDILVSVYEDYFEAESIFATVNAQESYPLPANFYKLLGADQIIANSQAVPLRPYEALNRNAFNSYTPAGLQIQLRYVPTLAPLVSDSDTFDGVNGWEEYVIVDAARKAAIKEESFELAGQLKADKADLKARIEAMAPDRDSGYGDRVNDVYGEQSLAEIYYSPLIRYRLVGQLIRLQASVVGWGAII